MPHPNSSSRPWVLLVALAALLPWGLGCDSGSTPSAPVEATGIEEITEADIAAAGDLEGLTEEQRERVRAILGQARQQLRRLRAAVRAGRIAPERARRLARELHERVVRRLSEFLTHEQIDGLLEHLRERRQERPELDLTEDHLVFNRTIPMRDTWAKIKKRQQKK